MLNPMMRSLGEQHAEYLAKSAEGRKILQDQAEAAIGQKLFETRNQGPENSLRPLTPGVHRSILVNRAAKLLDRALVKPGLAAGACCLAAGILGQHFPEFLATPTGATTVLALSGVAVHQLPFHPLTAYRDAYTAEAVWQTWTHNPHLDDKLYIQFLAQHHGVTSSYIEDQKAELMEKYRDRITQVICHGPLDEAQIFADFLVKQDFDGARNILNSFYQPRRVGETAFPNEEERKKLLASALLTAKGQSLKTLWELFDTRYVHWQDGTITITDDVDKRILDLHDPATEEVHRALTCLAIESNLQPTSDSIETIQARDLTCVTYIHSLSETTFALNELKQILEEPEGGNSYTRACSLLGAFGAEGRKILADEIKKHRESNVRMELKWWIQTLTNAYLESLIKTAPSLDDMRLETLLYKGFKLTGGPQIAYVLKQGLPVTDYGLDCIPRSPFLGLKEDDHVALSALARSVRGKLPVANADLRLLDELTPFVNQNDARKCLEEVMVKNCGKPVAVKIAGILRSANHPDSGEAFGECLAQELELWKTQGTVNNSIINQVLGYVLVQKTLPTWFLEYVVNFVSMIKPQPREGSPAAEIENYYSYQHEVTHLIVQLGERLTVQRLISNIYAAKFAETQLPANGASILGCLIEQYIALDPESQGRDMMRAEIFPRIFRKLLSPEGLTLINRLTLFKFLVNQMRRENLSADPLFGEIETVLRSLPGLHENDIQDILSSKAKNRTNSKSNAP